MDDIAQECVKSKKSGRQQNSRKHLRFKERKTIATMCDKYHNNDMYKIDSLVIQNKIDKLGGGKLS